MRIARSRAPDGELESTSVVLATAINCAWFGVSREVGRVALAGEKEGAVKVASNLGSPGAEEPALVAAAGSEHDGTT